jgi:hypothetical protein
MVLSIVLRPRPAVVTTWHASKNTARLEQAANDKYARGKIEDDGSIALLPGDF